MDERTELLNFIIQKIFNGVTADEVLEVMFAGTKDAPIVVGLKVGERALEPAQVLTLKHEAEMIEGTKLWKMIRDRMQYHAQIRLSKDSVKPDDLIFPKAMIWTLQAEQDILNTIKKFEQKPTK